MSWRFCERSNSRHTKNYIFEAFFTTKGACEGASVGLGIVQRIVANRDGESHAEFHVYKECP